MFYFKEAKKQKNKAENKKTNQTIAIVNCIYTQIAIS